jgi:hypothetical protein
MTGGVFTTGSYRNPPGRLPVPADVVTVTATGPVPEAAGVLAIKTADDWKVTMVAG